MDQWRVTLTVEVEATTQEEAIHAAMRLDDSVIVSSAINESRREREHAALMQQLWDALDKPFDEGVDTVRKFINIDHKLLWDKRIVRWCVANSDAIALTLGSKP